MADQQRRLGRGLGSLLSSSSTRETIRGMTEGVATPPIQEVPVGSIYPNRRQPRQTFDLETIAELAASMQSSGLISPIVVSPDREGRFELIAGERRWRAACQLGWETIRAQLRNTTDQERLELALIENVQREDLNAIDRAHAYHQLVTAFDLTHEAISTRIGLNRSTLTNLLRLLDLPEEVQDMVKDGAISAGHARALLALESTQARMEFADQVQLEELSVRALEKRIQNLKAKETPTDNPKPPRDEARSPQVREMEQLIARLLGTKVRINPKGEGGKIVIDFFSLDDFERIAELLGPASGAR